QALYSYRVEAAVDSEEALKLAMTAVKQTMADYIAKNYTTGKTGIVALVAAVTDVSQPENVKKFVSRVLVSDELSSPIVNNSGEFTSKPPRMYLMHADAAYGHREAQGAPMQNSLLRTLIVIDTTKNELSLVGTVDCDF